jgi:GGDEF domain-containing protein
MAVQSIPVLLMFGIAVYAGVSHLMMFLNLKENRENLYFAMACFAIAVYDAMCIGLYNAHSVETGIGWQRGQYFAANILMIAILYFTCSLTRTRIKWVKALFAGAIVLMMLAGALSPGWIFDAGRPSVRKIILLNFPITYYEARPGFLLQVYIALIVLAVVYVFYLLFKSLLSDKRRDLIPLVVGFLAFAASSLLDGAIANDAVPFVYTSEYSFLLLIVMMDFTVQKRFSGLYREVGSMNVRLEAKVLERTSDIRSLSEDLSAANKDLEEKNRILGELVERDSLTRLLNHAAFHSRLAEVFNESKRHHFCLAVLMMDLDHFKKINDGYGHPVGDRIILEVAGVLTRSSRNYDVKARYDEHLDKTPPPRVGGPDVAGRYGGDEFAVILPYSNGQETKIVADRICRRINEIRFEERPDLRVSVSMGGVVYDPRTECESERLLMQIADRALYAAKNGGRNQVVIETLGSCGDDPAPA